MTFLCSVILRMTIIMKIAQTTSEAQNYTSCTSIMCENDSLCKTVVYLSDGLKEEHAQCVCHGSFTGPRCEALINLVASDIHAQSVIIGISFVQLSNRTISENVLNHNLIYSLHYWNNETSKSCSVISESSARKHVIYGLQPETAYTFCANSDSFFTLCPLENVSNCLIIKTPKLMAAESFPMHLVPVSAIVLILILVSVVTVLALRKRHFKCMESKEINSFWTDETKSKRKRHKKKSKRSHDHELFLLPGTPPSERLQINTPSSPGRPKHSLSKQSHSYASFSAKNDKTIALKTILEYVPNDDNDQTETCLVIHNSSEA